MAYLCSMSIYFCKISYEEKYEVFDFFGITDEIGVVCEPPLHTIEGCYKPFLVFSHLSFVNPSWHHMILAGTRD